MTALPLSPCEDGWGEGFLHNCMRPHTKPIKTGLGALAPGCKHPSRFQRLPQPLVPARVGEAGVQDGILNGEREPTLDGTGASSASADAAAVPRASPRASPRAQRWAHFMADLEAFAALPAALPTHGSLVRVAGLVLEAAGVRAPVGAVCEVRGNARAPVLAEVVPPRRYVLLIIRSRSFSESL